MPGKLKGGPSARTSRCTNSQQAAQQSKYINKTATFERIASAAKLDVIEKAKAIVA
jgi:hypothetical protein